MPLQISYFVHVKIIWILYNLKQILFTNSLYLFPEVKCMEGNNSQVWDCGKKALPKKSHKI